jgi:hypothetical protein
MKMKPLIGRGAIVAAASLMMSSYVAAECAVPSFLNEKSRYVLAWAGNQTGVTILEIDKKTCWIKVSQQVGQTQFEERWYNLTQVLSLTNKDGTK